MNLAIAIYYKLTSYMPRRMPNSEAQYYKMKDTLTHYFGVEDTDYVWVTVASQVQNTPPNSLTKSYGSIANAAKRLKINAIAQEQKVLAGNRLNERIKELALKMKEEEDNNNVHDLDKHLQEGPHDF